MALRESQPVFVTGSLKMAFVIVGNVRGSRIAFLRCRPCTKCPSAFWGQASVQPSESRSLSKHRASLGETVFRTSLVIIGTPIIATARLVSIVTLTHGLQRRQLSGHRTTSIADDQTRQSGANANKRRKLFHVYHPFCCICMRAIRVPSIQYSWTRISSNTKHHGFDRLHATQCGELRRVPLIA